MAADAGTVVSAVYSSSYGNYVVISHGNGMVTLYAHMNSMAVSSGQTVTKGQTIGYVGSTGWSTGPHCHFEVKVNGQLVDPLSYF
jgi:murein DD-endopeptidase MepM/ murein hydrolase activator NlpD